MSKQRYILATMLMMAIGSVHDAKGMVIIECDQEMNLGNAINKLYDYIGLVNRKCSFGDDVLEHIAKDSQCTIYLKRVRQLINVALHNNLLVTLADKQKAENAQKVINDMLDKGSEPHSVAQLTEVACGLEVLDGCAVAYARAKNFAVPPLQVTGPTSSDTSAREVDIKIIYSKEMSFADVVTKLHLFGIPKPSTGTAPATELGMYLEKCKQVLDLEKAYNLSIFPSDDMAYRDLDDEITHYNQGSSVNLERVSEIVRNLYVGLQTCAHTGITVPLLDEAEDPVSDCSPVKDAEVTHNQMTSIPISETFNPTQLPVWFLKQLSRQERSLVVPNKKASETYVKHDNAAKELSGQKAYNTAVNILLSSGNYGQCAVDLAHINTPFMFLAVDNGKYGIGVANVDINQRFLWKKYAQAAVCGGALLYGVTALACDMYGKQPPFISRWLPQSAHKPAMALLSIISGMKLWEPLMWCSNIRSCDTTLHVSFPGEPKQEVTLKNCAMFYNITSRKFFNSIESTTSASSISTISLPCTKKSR